MRNPCGKVHFVFCSSRLRLSLAACLALVAANSLAQAQSQTASALLPSAPEPQNQEAAAPKGVDAAQQGHDTGPAAAKASEAAREPDPVVTMFPHPEDARYWISGQANIIFQGQLPFHSPYQGTNSFRNAAEYKDVNGGDSLHSSAP